MRLSQSKAKSILFILDDLASRFFGCDEAIAQIYLKKYLIGAVARAFNSSSEGHPGEKNGMS